MYLRNLITNHSCTVSPNQFPFVLLKGFILKVILKYEYLGEYIHDTYMKV